MSESEWQYFELEKITEVLDHMRVPVNGQDRSTRLGDIPYYGANGLQGFIDGWIFDEPLILIAEDGGYFDEFATRPVAYKIEGKSWVNNHAHILRPNEQFDFDFVFYSLQHKNITPFIKGGTRAKLNQKELREIKLKCPIDKCEQQGISIVLLTIDQAIEKTEALIKKYQQIKAGLMHDLFTRGIGTDGKLRPPREEAPELYQRTVIGWIPKDWVLNELNNLASIVSGVTLGPSQKTSNALLVPYLRVANVQDGYLDLSEVKNVSVSQRTLEHLRLQAGDVLMNEGGDFDKLGRGTIWQDEIADCIHQNHVFRVRVNRKMLQPSFLTYHSQSLFGKKYFIRSSKQSTNLASINSTQLKEYPIGLPCLQEQTIIESKVNAVNNRIAAMVSESEKLKYQKSGLMQDLLTGKVPVKVPTTEQATA